MEVSDSVLEIATLSWYDTKLGDVAIFMFSWIIVT